ncbi:cache domain-containing sensor histidine kinase [Cohnella caldifontis]|uniref:cache domain-containing sensor histidine kinase n=1 Tax=Cohnella caldifontis TaxID=3027471 RepID=UPI0023EA9A01|nr:sensor histidine kinase [Cohnella sp. YIM B05605]
MKRAFLKSSLRYQLMITSLLCLIIPLSISLWIGNMNTNHLIKAQAERNSSESLKFVKSQLVNIVEGLYSIANSIEFDPSVTPYLKSATYSNPETSVTMINEKLTNLTHDKAGVYVTVLTTDNRFFTNYGMFKFTPIQFYREPWFERLNRTSTYENYWVGLQPNYLEQSVEPDPHLITFARAFRTTKGIYAYVVVSITETRIRSLFESYADQSIYLLDDRGTILSGDRPGSPFDAYREVQQPRANPVVTVGGKDYMYVTDSLPFNGWTLVSLMPYAKATAGINRIYFTNFFWQVVFILIFVVILILLLRRFTQPIIRLGEVASSIESGNLSVRSEVRGKTEIGKLGRSFDHMLDRIEEMFRQIQREQEQARKAELSMLQAQISPHFLFNILNSIRMRIQLKGDRENADLLRNLSRLLRMTIQRQDKMVELEEEAAIAVSYMELMKSAMKTPFRYELDLDEETKRVLVPRFTLQPIIENALKHGLDGGEGTIAIRSVIAGDSLCLSVQDNGAGMNPEALGRLKEKLNPRAALNRAAEEPDGMSGIGLANVYDRLIMLYGERFSVRIDSAEGMGTRVDLMLPRMEGTARD